MDEVFRIRPTFGHVVVDDTSIPAADIELGGVPRGAVLILCEPDELESTSDDIGNRFAEHGYESCTSDLAAVLGRDDSATRAVSALLDYVARRDWSPDQVGVVAYGAAGRAALLAATSLPVGAAVTAAPRLDDVVPPNANPTAVSVPWLGMFAADAPDQEATRLAAFAAEIGAASPAYTTVLAYPHVSGPFYRDSREPWEHAASFDSWQRTLEWLNLRVAPRLTPLAQAWRASHSAA
jgi:carboxymethylenebutenolidase